MNEFAPERTGVLIIRVWMEGGAQAEFRARLSGARDVHGAAEAVGVASTRDDVLEQVAEWLERFLAL